MKSAGILIPALFIVFLNNVIGQVYFDNLYGSDSNSEGIDTYCSIEYKSGYLNLAYSGGEFRKPLLFQIDGIGNLLQEFYLDEGDSLWQFAVRLLQYDDSTLYALCGTKGYENGQSLPLDYGVFKFNGFGESLQFNSYGHSYRSEYAQAIIKAHDGRILIFGSATIETPSATEADFYLISLDLVGNLLFEIEYGGSNYEGGQDLLQTPDHGFLLLGWTRSYGAGQRDFYLVKTDSVGNQQWQKTYGGSDMETGTCIIPLNDGNYLLAGAQIIGGVDKGKLIKIEPEGTVVWQNEYIHPGCSASEINKVIELSDGSIIAAGVSDKSGEGNSGWLLKTDSEGNELWQRKYNKNNNTDLFYSVLLANDGGFLLSGQARNAETNNQDAWLLKVDSVGCPYPNCLVGIDEAESTKVVVDVWPNPASEVMNVQLQQPGTAQITFTDMAGSSYSPPAKEGQGVVGPYMQYDVSALSNGVYVLSVVQTEMKTSLKIVVQH